MAGGWDLSQYCCKPGSPLGVAGPAKHLTAVPPWATNPAGCLVCSASLGLLTCRSWSLKDHLQRPKRLALDLVGWLLSRQPRWTLVLGWRLVSVAIREHTEHAAYCWTDACRKECRQHLTSIVSLPYVVLSCVHLQQALHAPERQVPQPEKTLSWPWPPPQSYINIVAMMPPVTTMVAAQCDRSC